MAKIKEKDRAIKLRKAGWSYSQIKAAIGVSKGSLSLWLGDMPLSRNRMRELRDWNEKRIEKYRETRRIKREKMLAGVYKEEKSKILPLSKRDVFIGGLFLYWGEGGKTKMAELGFSNTNPAMCKFCVFWMVNELKFPKRKIKIRLHLYKDMSVATETKFWSKKLKISQKQFRSPYIKNSRLENLSYKRGYGHGTCNILVGNAILARKVLMGLKAIEDYFTGLVA